MKKIRFILFFVIFLFFNSYSLFSQENQTFEMQKSLNSFTVEGANKRTAVRCLDLAKNFLLDNQFKRAYNQAELGLAYDSSIADLWYIQALSLKEQDALPYEVLEKLAIAQKSNVWVYWDRSVARLLEADLYSQTARSDQALRVLDESPTLISRKAQYIRAKSLYNTGNINRARSVILGASMAYGNDPTFATLFFTRELPLLWHNDFKIVPPVEELCTIFIKRYNELASVDRDVLLFAAPFAGIGSFDVKTGESPRELEKRLLKTWLATGGKNEYFPLFALMASLFDDKEVVFLIEQYLNDTGEIDFLVLDACAKLIRDDEAFSLLQDVLYRFAGTLCFDLNNDFIPDLKASYKNGRPSFISYDENQDGMLSWNSHCDTGSPSKLSIPSKDVRVIYGRWPYVCQVEWSKKRYDLVPDALPWSPLKIEISSSFTRGGEDDFSFYIPALYQNTINIYEDQLFNCSSTVIIPTEERDSSVIRYSVKSGVIQNATWLVNEQPYASGMFENGLLQFRNLDNDNDGFFEVYEIYAYERNLSSKFDSLPNFLFGDLPLFAQKKTEGLYLKKIMTDSDSNSIPEYTEEYMIDNGRLCTWYNGRDEKWDVQYIQYQDEFARLTRFRNRATNSIVEVYYEDGVPLKVIEDGREQSVTKDIDCDFYWIGEPAEPGYAVSMIDSLTKMGNMTFKTLVSDVQLEVESDVSFRIFAAKYGNLYFGEVIE